MCWACQEDELRAAYRDYLAQRAIERQAAGAEGGHGTPTATSAQPDWAKGAWFAAEVEPSE